MKLLRELKSNISDFKSRQKKATKPFAPHGFDGIVSNGAPYLYSQEELTKVQHLSSFYKNANEDEKVKKQIVITLKKKKPRKRFIFNTRKGSKSKKASTSNNLSVSKRASTLSPPRVILALPANPRT
ncbi:hypothetical protein MTR_5g060530 [Medicago truncatula]|uniref:Uncharacterized protein n=1 Tax=Medicago truncatula TaxID=3880 RepID=G7K9X5_MEDTR|nr:hypothetical protein MTR_5g060530 [Medicago truncatula]